jgi:hypothetical protein
MIALGYGVYLKWKATQASASFSNVGALALRTERREGALRVSWNRDTLVVNRAKDAMLSIRDGDLKPQELHLELEQLRMGSVVYTPVNKSVLFQLEVTGRDDEDARDHPRYCGTQSTLDDPAGSGKAVRGRRFLIAKSKVISPTGVAA